MTADPDHRIHRFPVNEPFVHPSTEKTQMSRVAYFALIASLLLVPALAQAQRSCPEERPHELALDLAGVETLSIELGRHSLRLDGAEEADGVVRGRACATSPARLAELTLVQQRDGTRLILRAEDGGSGNAFRLFGKSDYAVHELALRIPPHLTVELGVGSGDALVNRVAALDASVGSGDLQVRDITGPMSLRVGSGDVDIGSVGALSLQAVGSGDVIARDLGADLEIGSVGSGDVSVRGIGGEVRIGSVGSGDIALSEVAGGDGVGSVGSGDLALKGVGASVEVDRLGSGDLHLTDVEGDVHIRRKGSGDVYPHNVKGEVSVVLKPRD